jgi:hypothetical protein
VLVKRRDRILAICTLAMAGLWAIATYAAARHVERANSTRIIGALMTAGLTPRPNPYTTQPARGLWAAMTLSPEVYAEHERRQKQEARQIGVTEGIVYYWKRAMWALAGLLALLALLALVGRAARACHLAIALLMLLGTALTLTAMRLLQSPQWGGLLPLSVGSHILIAAAGSAYPMVLLLLFWQKRPQVTGTQRIAN